PPEPHGAARAACRLGGRRGEPLEPKAEEGENAELVDMTRRFWIGLALPAPLLPAMLGGLVPAIHTMSLLARLGEFVPAIDPMHRFGHAAVAWAQLALATPVVLWCGWPFFVRGWQSIAKRSTHMFTLIALGTGAAWLYSVLATAALTA